MQVATDNWPADYIYISRRLTHEIVNQHAAARRPGWLRRITAALPGTGISAEFAPGDVDPSNPFDLARHATEAVTDLTGTLDSPGPYIRATLDFSWDAVPVRMRRDDANDPVACFFADVRVVGVGGVFVSLIGSASNFLGIAPADNHRRWMPSDALGLYHILSQISEPDDPGVRAELVDPYERPGPDIMVRQAASIYEQNRPLYGRGTVEVLAKSHTVQSDIDLSTGFHPSWNGNLANGDHGRYDLAVLGAPVWVATPEPRADPFALQTQKASPQR